MWKCEGCGASTPDTCTCKRMGGETPKPLKSLDGWNREHRAVYDDLQRLTRDAKRNGIACPLCGAELYDDGPARTTGIGPTEVTVRCTSEPCSFLSTRLT